MSYINLYDCVGDVMNKPRCISELCKNSIEMGMEDGTDVELARKLNTLYSLDTSRYFTYLFREVGKSDVHACFFWLDTGCTNIVGDKIYAQFSKSAFGWQGCYVGTEDEISYHQIGKTLRTLSLEQEEEISDTSCVTETNSQTNSSDVNLLDDGDDTTYTSHTNENDSFYTDLFNRLLIQKGWSDDSSSLRNYIYPY